MLMALSFLLRHLNDTAEVHRECRLLLFYSWMLTIHTYRLFLLGNAEITIAMIPQLRVLLSNTKPLVAIQNLASVRHEYVILNHS